MESEGGVLVVVPFGVYFILFSSELQVSLSKVRYISVETLSHNDDAATKAIDGWPVLSASHPRQGVTNILTTHLPVQQRTKAPCQGQRAHCVPIELFNFLLSPL